jgi:hypothetical protein
MEEQIKQLKQFLKTASDIEKEYALQLLTWLNGWLSPEPNIESEGGSNNPPPPPPHP